jgi:hypothetical protein
VEKSSDSEQFSKALLSRTKITIPSANAVAILLIALGATP